jgi:hypothetical protein
VRTILLLLMPAAQIILFGFAVTTVMDSRVYSNCLVNMLSHTDKESFTGLFASWSDKWFDFLKERSTDPKTHKTDYTHKRLRSAYLSLKRNMPYLWTWYDHIELRIPNITTVWRVNLPV